MVRRKQKLEGYLKKSLKAQEDFLYNIKLQVMPLAHQSTLSDFLIMNKSGIVYAVECKQVTCKDNKGSFSIDRLTQKNSLLKFEDFSEYTESYVCILFYNQNITKSKCYLIPVNILFKLLEELGKKSINMDDAQEYCGLFEIKYIKGYFDLNSLY